MKSGLRFYCLLWLSLFFLSCAKDNTTGSSVATINIPTHPIQTPQDLDVIMNQIGDARVVLLGEASHGTAEYYEWRAALSKRLIQEKGFDFIAVEGEWADSYRVNQFIKGPQRDSLAAVALLGQYDRWPTWMWGNAEVASLVTWLNQYNQGKAPGDKAGFFGLDVYCLWESMQELMPYIQGNDSLMRMAQQVQQCFRPYSADPMEYAYAVAGENANCRTQTERLYQAIMSFTGGSAATTEANFVMQQNALVALNGERYYRESVRSYPGSWNIRDQHMSQTIQRLLDFHGPNSKIIVWEHNTHVGDARFTDMLAQGMVNVGQLVRETYGPQNVYIVGFGSYSGSVIAANEWGGPIETMNVPQAQRGSWEHLLHQMSPTDKIILSSEIKENTTLSQPIGNRAIGVVYNPRQEAGNYVPSIIPNRYDAFIFIDQTRALRPLGTTPRQEPPDTYPSGY
jgi:erythromycin esterase-like protein